MDKGYPKYELEPSLRVTTLEELMEHFRSKDIAAALGKLKLPTSGTKRDRIECLLDWAGQPDEAAIYARQDDYIPTDSWIDLDYDDIRNSWHNYPYDIVTKVLNEFDLESQNRVNERLNLTWTMKYYLNHRFTGEKELDLGEYILGIRKSDSLEATHVTSESFQCPYCGEQRSMSNPWPMALGGGVSGKRWQCRMCGKLVGERVVASTLERFIVPFLNFPVMALAGTWLGLVSGLCADAFLADVIGSAQSDAFVYIVYGIASALSGAFVGIFYGIREFIAKGESDAELRTILQHYELTGGLSQYEIVKRKLSMIWELVGGVIGGALVGILGGWILMLPIGFIVYFIDLVGLPVMNSPTPIWGATTGSAAGVVVFLSMKKTILKGKV